MKMETFRSEKKMDRFMAACRLKEYIPELEKVLASDIQDSLRGSGLIFYEEKKKSKPSWIRFTLPFALITIVILFIIHPIKYMITNQWGWENSFFLFKWFEKLRLT